MQNNSKQVPNMVKWNGPLVPLAPRLERETRDRGNN